MNNEGAGRWKDEIQLKTNSIDLKLPLPARMHQELIWGYSAAITFVDTQLGRVLDTLDELKLWNNLTIVLTADHGMHNGEKGIWEKWSMFDESTRVPLMVYHPLSPFGGQHYTEPVELIDVFPTVIDLLNPPFHREKIYNAPRTRHPRKIVPLAGKSLAPMVLGAHWIPHLGSFRAHPLLAADYYTPIAHGSGTAAAAASKKEVKQQLRMMMGGGGGGGGGSLLHHPVMPIHKQKFALSQIWRCSPKVLTSLEPRNATHSLTINRWFQEHRREDRSFQFLDCDMRNVSEAVQREEDSFMGYSMRTTEFRYTIWLPFDRVSMTPQWDDSPRNSTIAFFAEELYDHRGETLAQELGTREMVNLADEPTFALVKQNHRQRLLSFLRSRVLYKSTLTASPPAGWLLKTWNAAREAMTTPGG